MTLKHTICFSCPLILNHTDNLLTSLLDTETYIQSVNLAPWYWNRQSVSVNLAPWYWNKDNLLTSLHDTETYNLFLFPPETETYNLFILSPDTETYRQSVYLAPWHWNIICLSCPPILKHTDNLLTSLLENNNNNISRAPFFTRAHSALQLFTFTIQ